MNRFFDEGDKGKGCYRCGSAAVKWRIWSLGMKLLAEGQGRTPFAIAKVEAEPKLEGPRR